MCAEVVATLLSLCGAKKLSAYSPEALFFNRFDLSFRFVATATACLQALLRNSSGHHGQP